MAARVLTLLRFDAPLERDLVDVEGRPTRFRLVDVGEQLLGLEPLGEPAPGESWSVRVRYREGPEPQSVSFALVSHPSRVDKEVEVVRPPRTVEVLEAAVAQKDARIAALEAQARAHDGLAFSDPRGTVGLGAGFIPPRPADTQSGLKLEGGTRHRSERWAIVSLQVQNLPGQRPWWPGEARLTRVDGSRVKVSVGLNTMQLAPGETGVVTLQTETPSWPATEVLRLELFDSTGGRRLLLPHVKF